MGGAQLMASVRRALVVRLLMPLALAFMAWLIWTNLPAITHMASAAQWGLMAWAVVSLVLANVGMAVVFAGFVQRVSGRGLPVGQLVGVFLVSQVAKYVPGRIWSVAMQATMLRTTQSVRGVLAANLELAIINLLLVTGAGMAFVAWMQLGAVAGLLGLLVTWGLAVWVSRFHAVRILGGMLYRTIPCLGKIVAPLDEVGDTLGKSDSGRYAGLLVFLTMYCLGWWLLARGTTTLDAHACMAVVAALSLSYGVGVVSMLPAGLGAREGALVLLGPTLGIAYSDMAVIAIASRTVMLVMDALAAAAGGVLLQFGRDEV